MIKKLLLMLLLSASVSADSTGFWWHKTPSTKADTSDATFIRPSDWNTWHRLFPESTAVITEEFLVGGLSGGDIGEYGFSQANGGSFLLGRGEVNHPGCDTLYTAATAVSSAPTIYVQQPNGIFLPTEFFDITWIIKLPATDSNVVRVGLLSGTASSGNNGQPQHGIWLETDSNETAWWGEIRANNVSTRTAASITSETTSWVKFRIWRMEYGVVGTKTDDSIAYSVNNGTPLKILASGTSFPTAALTPFAHIGNNNKAALRSMVIDYCGLRLFPISR